MAVESMTVHPNSPTANHEHNSLLTDERSSNIIFLSNYLFILCFLSTKSMGIILLFFFQKGLKSTFFLGNEYRGNERHFETLTRRKSGRSYIPNHGHYSVFKQNFIYNSSHFSPLFFAIEGPKWPLNKDHRSCISGFLKVKENGSKSTSANLTIYTLAGCWQRLIYSVYFENPAYVYCSAIRGEKISDLMSATQLARWLALYVNAD